jgi:hypothetical protein
MGMNGDFSASLDMRTMHDLREGLTLTKGWLEALFRGWEDFDDVRKREMVAAALLGANQMTFLLEQLEGRPIEEIRLPHERMAEEFLKLAER